MITRESGHIQVEGHYGTWHVIDDGWYTLTPDVNGEPKVYRAHCFLLEHDEYGDEAANGRYGVRFSTTPAPNRHTAQEERPAPAEDNNTYEVVEEMPKYPGGTEAMMAFIGQHLQYPSVSIENGVQGRVVVQFVIEKDGTPTDFKVIRNVDPYLDKEAIRVLSLMPKWTPGRQRGVPVKVRYTVPVTFRLQ